MDYTPLYSPLDNITPIRRFSLLLKPVRKRSIIPGAYPGTMSPIYLFTEIIGSPVCSRYKRCILQILPTENVPYRNLTYASNEPGEEKRKVCTTASRKQHTSTYLNKTLYPIHPNICLYKRTGWYSSSLEYTFLILNP